MTTRGVALFLAVLTAGALLVNAVQWRGGGGAQPMLLVPALGLLAMLVALPFLSGWNPFARTRELATCGACGTLWSPHADGGAFCPACGGKTGPRAA